MGKKKKDFTILLEAVDCRDVITVWTVYEKNRLSIVGKEKF